MKKSRGGRLQDSRHAQRDQPRIKTYNAPVIPVDPAHQAAADMLQGHKLPEILRTYGHIRDLPGQLRAIADGDSHIGRSPSRLIVNPVSHHEDLPAF